MLERAHKTKKTAAINQTKVLGNEDVGNILETYITNHAARQYVTPSHILRRNNTKDYTQHSSFIRFKKNKPKPKHQSAYKKNLSENFNCAYISNMCYSI